MWRKQPSVAETKTQEYRSGCDNYKYLNVRRGSKTLEKKNRKWLEKVYTQQHKKKKKNAHDKIWTDSGMTLFCPHYGLISVWNI